MRAFLREWLVVYGGGWSGLLGSGSFILVSHLLDLFDVVLSDFAMEVCLIGD